MPEIHIHVKVASRPYDGSVGSTCLNEIARVSLLRYKKGRPKSPLRIRMDRAKAVALSHHVHSTHSAHAARHWPGASFFGSSAIMASVVMSSEATDAAS